MSIGTPDLALRGSDYPAQEIIALCQLNELIEQTTTRKT
jgi:hypothetical protein